MSFLKRKIKHTERTLIDWLTANPRQVLDELAEYTGKKGKHERCSYLGCTLQVAHGISHHELRLPYGTQDQGEGTLARQSIQRGRIL